MERLVRGRLVPLLETLNERGADDAVVDLQDVLLRFAFDNICAAAFGVEAGCLANGLPDVPFVRALMEAARAVREFAERTVADRRAELRKVGDLAGRCDLSRLMSSSPILQLVGRIGGAAAEQSGCLPDTGERKRPRAAVLASHRREKREHRHKGVLDIFSDQAHMSGLSNGKNKTGGGRNGLGDKEIKCHGM